MISSHEKKWVFWFAFVILAVTSIPYFLGYALQGNQWHFTGFLFGVEDGNSYIAKMLLGSSGAWLFRTPYTAYPQSGFLAFLPYLLLGKLTSFPGQHEQLVALFQVFRWVGGYFMILSTYKFMALFVSDVPLRKWGTAFSILGGGLGWVAILGASHLWQNNLPLEFYSPETFGFLSIYGLPHLALGRAFLLWAIVHYLNANISDHRSILMGGLCLLGLGFLQPLTIVTGWIILGSHLLFTMLNQVWKRRKNQPQQWDIWTKYFRRAFFIVVISSPFVFYNLFFFTSDTFLKGWLDQNKILSPPPLDYFLGYILVLPFAVLGLKEIFKEMNWHNWIIVSWIFILPILIYFPNNLQRRLPEGGWVVLCLAAILGIATLKNKVKKFALTFVSLGFASTGLLFLGGCFSILQVKAPLYISNSYVLCFQSLNSLAKPNDVVLASYEVANAIPAWAPIRTVIGLGPESIQLNILEPRVKAFYSQGMMDEQRISFLNEFDIQYVIWGENERKIGDWSPLNVDYLSLKYDNGQCSLLKRIKNP